MPRIFISLALVIAAILAVPLTWTLAEDDDADHPIPPKSPAESRDAIQLPDGYVAEVVAAEPLVRDPVAFAWGPDSRLWVVEMADYPEGMDGEGEPGGRIRVLEDTDGDGEYDEATLFLDGLTMPKGIAPWRDGILYTAAPDIVYAADTTGDGKADHQEVLFTGFGVRNPQLRVNGLRWGLDNWLYVANGWSGGEPKSTETGEQVELGSQDLRLNPDTGDLDPVAGRSQFGRNRDDFGEWFGGDNSHPLWHFVMDQRYAQRNPHINMPDLRRQLVTPRNAPVFPASRLMERYHADYMANRFTSACSSMIYRDRLLFGPGLLEDGIRHGFACEPVHNLVSRRILHPEGATFTSERAPGEEESEFLASEDNWFRPVMARTGPDGALWIADMYRFVVEHPDWVPDEVWESRWEGEVDVRAGESMGRIYRIYHEDRPPRPTRNLEEASTAELVAALDTPNGTQRDLAHQMLIWRNDEAAVAPLQTMVREHDNPLARLQALAALDGLDQLNADLLTTTLADDHRAVRRHALRLAEQRADEMPQLLAAVTRLVNDPDPHTRFQLACSLGAWEDAAAGNALGRLAIESGDDPYMRAAVLSGALVHGDALTQAVLADDVDTDAAGRWIGPLLTLAQATQQHEAVAALLERLLRPAGDTPASDQPTYATWQLAALADWRDKLAEQRTSLDDLRDTAPALAAAIDRLPDVTEAAGWIAADDDRPTAARVAAVRLLGRDPEHHEADIDLLASLLDVRVPSDVQRAAVAALSRTGDEAVADILLEGWSSHAPSLRNTIVDRLLQRGPWVHTLLNAVEEGRIAVADIDSSRRDRLLRSGNEGIRERSAELLQDDDTPRDDVVEQFRPALDMEGDADRGRTIFADRCAQCHRVDGVGKHLGPDLRSVTDRSPEGLLIAIVDPNRAVEPRYTAYQAILSNGQAAFGILTDETDRAITLVNLDGEPQQIRRDALQQLHNTGRSLMPEGIETDMSPQDMADLLAFLGYQAPAADSD